MATLSSILEAEDITSLQSLQLFARTVVEGFTTGQHASPHKGFSVEFRQHRPYVQGDDIRRLDWKIFGRADRFYIREFDEETNLRATLVLDASGSMNYRGQKGVLKFDYARKLAAAMAYLLMSQQDAVGLVTFDTKIRDFIPNQTRITHLHHMLETMIKTEPGKDTTLAPVLESLAQRLKRRGLVILISDFFDDAASILKAIGVLRKKGHEVIAMQLWDRDELEFPFGQWSRFENLENAEDSLLLDPAAVRQRYLEVLKTFQGQLKEGFRKHQVDYLSLPTDESHAAALRSYLALRMR
ncbi:DUF58 domain-containing protein [Prosthecobacter dejongeii]|uniref:Uncharacterized protein (DUF58 family) n=1 Tax=Prosthecobacter dejongeii TaxID=48465 RepID=A0A7W7YKV0_9BACT|nr:DUF58 domain-containing protein [Prosthecobacter dejongeii]MBB5038068.1 uncharacterized protein (DUF58 family) [Prosthecobacter dejongeii]